MPERIIQATLLHGRWLHAHEEDSPKTTVYRPAISPLPPARGRTGYEFLPDGRLRRIAPGADDRTASADGTWSVDSEGRIVIRLSGGATETLEVVALDHERLVVERSG